MKLYLLGQAPRHLPIRREAEYCRADIWMSDFIATSPTYAAALSSMRMVANGSWITVGSFIGVAAIGLGRWFFEWLGRWFRFWSSPRHISGAMIRRPSWLICRFARWFYSGCSTWLIGGLKSWNFNGLFSRRVSGSDPT